MDSEVPLYVTNLERFTVNYRSLTAAGSVPALARRRTCRRSPTFSTACRSVFGRCSAASRARSSAVLETTPRSKRLAGAVGVRGRDAVSAARETRSLHLARLGDGLATGAPVRRSSLASTSTGWWTSRRRDVTSDGLQRPTASRSFRARRARSLARDAGLRLLRRSGQLSPLFVRADGEKGIALMPLDYRFAIDNFRASNFTVYRRRSNPSTAICTRGARRRKAYTAPATQWMKSCTCATRATKPRSPRPRAPISSTSSIHGPDRAHGRRHHAVEFGA